MRNFGKTYFMWEKKFYIYEQQLIIPYNGIINPYTRWRAVKDKNKTCLYENLVVAEYSSKSWIIIKLDFGSL